jgi:hypothetical protein
MSKIQGKQIANSTITQSNLNLYEPILPNDAATKDYVDTQRSVEHLALSNKDMSALSTVGLTGVNLACAKPVMETPVSKSQVIVYINNVQIDTGPTKHAFFSADSGVTRKQNNDIVIGDYLYWDNDIAPYELESDDEIDFVYLRSGDSREQGDIIIDGGGV